MASFWFIFQRQAFLKPDHECLVTVSKKGDYNIIFLLLVNPRANCSFPLNLSVVKGMNSHFQFKTEGVKGD